MKKCSLAWIILLFCILGIGRQAEAYSVTMQKDGIYAEAIPDSFVNNTAAYFRKYVKKAMEYYNKYKDADDYTYITNVPDEYRDFIPVAKQIQDSDEIMIRNPFYIYDSMDESVPSRYYYFAEKNGKKLCMFGIDIEPETGKVSFWYDKIMDGYFVYDEKTLGETLFYWIDEAIYAETPDRTSIIRDMKVVEGEKMLGADGTTDWADELEDGNKKFQEKSYRDKKNDIIANLTKKPKDKFVNKVEKNLKLELEDEYVEPEKNVKESGRTGTYIVIGIGVLVIAAFVGGIILLKKRKRE